MAKTRIDVTAELVVSVRFQMEVDETMSLIETSKKARDAATILAQHVVGSQNRSEEASASVQRINSFTTKLS